MTETLTRDDRGRTVLRMERRLNHPPEKVWRALTEPAELNRWFPFAATEIDLRIGGTIRFDLSGDPRLPGASTMDAVITELEPPRVFAFEEPAGEVLEREGDNLLRFELRPDPAGCLLIFTHAFHDLPAAAANAAGWTVCFDTMEAALAGQPAGEPDFVSLHEAYAERFGLTAGSIEDTADGRRLRFDRQLMMRPVEQVWRALATPGPVAGEAPPEPFTADGVQAGAVVTQVDPPRLLAYAWPGGTVRWELSEHPAGARVTLIQTGGDPETARGAWQDRLDRLARSSVSA